MKFEEIEFYDYKIRMCLDNGIRMYLVSDLLRQYNEKHGTNKRFKKYLENKQTQELIEHMAKSVGWNSSILSNEGLEGQSTVGWNSDHQANDKFDICDVIQYITTPDFNGTNKGYIICEELLHACLMWADPAFACDVLRFLTRLRQEDNDYLRKANEELKQENKELKNRRVPDMEGQQWYYYITYKVQGDTVHIYSQYSNEKQWNKARSRMKKDGRSCVYSVKDLPNGFTFCDEIDEILKSICKKYGGVKKRKNHYMIPLDVWESNNYRIEPLFCSRAKQTRVGLGWRSDLDAGETK